MAPKVLYFDSTQGLIAMEYLENHKILRNKLIDGEKVSIETSGLSKREWNELMQHFLMNDKLV